MGRDFHRQNNLNPWRCHAVKVSGRTETNAFLPIKQSCRQYHRETRGIGGPPRSNLTFLVKGQLFPQEEILSGQGGAGLKETAQESGEIQTEVVKGQASMRKGFS